MTDETVQYPLLAWFFQERETFEGGFIVVAKTWRTSNLFSTATDVISIWEISFEVCNDVIKRYKDSIIYHELQPLYKQIVQDGLTMYFGWMDVVLYITWSVSCGWLYNSSNHNN